MPTLSSVPEELKDIFARACKNNEYFGNDGWHELHTPTLKSEIQALINQQIKSVFDELEGELKDYKPHRIGMHSDDWGGSSDNPCFCELTSTIQKIRSRYE